MRVEPFSHIHGGSPEQDMHRLRIPTGPVLDFSVNLNPLGPPPEIRRRWSEFYPSIAHYPHNDGRGVAQYYRSIFNIHPDHFLAGNGSTEMIYLVPRVFEFKRVAVISPSYHDYERASRLAGGEILRVPLSFQQDFAFPSHDRLSEVLQGVDAVCMARPNNPTGNLFPKADVLQLAHQFPDVRFVVDEAFIQFVSDWERQSLLFEAPRHNILVLHSLTKFFSVPGLRLGGVFADSAHIARLKKAKEPWSVNAVADRVGPLLAADPHYDQATREGIGRERRKIHDRISRMEGILPYPSTANFMLCRWTRTKDLDDLLTHLLSNGLYVRDCRNFPGLADNFFRLGIKGPKADDRLLSLLASSGTITPPPGSCSNST